MTFTFYFCQVLLQKKYEKKNQTEFSLSFWFFVYSVAGIILMTLAFWASHLSFTLTTFACRAVSWASVQVRLVRDKEIIRTHRPQGTIGSDYIDEVEYRGFEPLASTMRMSRATNCANTPFPVRSLKRKIDYSTFFPKRNPFFGKIRKKLRGGAKHAIILPAS